MDPVIVKYLLPTRVLNDVWINRGLKCREWEELMLTLLETNLLACLTVEVTVYYVWRMVRSLGCRIYIDEVVVEGRNALT